MQLMLTLTGICPTNRRLWRQLSAVSLQALRFNHEQLSHDCAAFCEGNLETVAAEPAFNELPQVLA